MTAETAAVRRIEVRPLSARAEFANVVRFGMVVLIGVWMFLAADSAAFRDRNDKQLLPFQSLIQEIGRAHV